MRTYEPGESVCARVWRGSLNALADQVPDRQVSDARRGRV